MNTDRLFDHLEDLHIYARRLTRDREKAQDLVQDTICHILSRDIQLGDVENPRAYMAVVMRNLYLDRARKDGRQPARVPIEAHDPIDVSADAFAEIACAETWAAVERLPEDFSRALRLRVEVGMSYADMAKELDVPIGTVMSRIARAREKLRTML